MVTRLSLVRSFAVVIIGLAAAAPAAAQEVVMTGPPPVLRQHVDGFIKAFNSGNAEAYEAMAQATFTAAHLKKQTAEERRAAYLKLRAEVGTVQLERGERSGPDAPLQVTFKGSVAPAVLWIDLDDASKFEGLRWQVQKKDDAAPRL